MIADSPLPWPLVPLSAVARLIRGVSFSGEESHNSPRPEHLPVLRAGNIADRLITDSDLVWVPQARISVEQRLQVGDIAICMSSGSAAVVGKTAALESEWEGSIGAFCAIIRPSGYIEPRYLATYLRGAQFAQWRKNQAQGANIQNLRATELLLVSIPLPPLSEQQRIVQILQEAEAIRRLNTEAEAKTAKLVPALFEESFGDPVMNPKKWDLEPLGSVINGTPKNGLYKPAEMYGEGAPIIRIGDFTGGILRSSKNLQRLRIAEDEIEQFGVSNGQILINRVNSIEHLGKSLLVASLTEPTVYESNMMRLDPRKEKVLPEFLIACLQHESLVAKLRAKAKKAINQASINQTDVLTLNIPVPPISKQEAFVAQVSQTEEIRLLAETSFRIERAVSASLSAHAFSGQLTADWREAYAARLSVEAQERDAALKQAGATVSRSRRATIQEEESIFEQRTDGIYSDLNREQRDLLFRIEQRVGGVNHARYFTAESLSKFIDGPLRRNPQAIEGHLAVLAARGLVIPVSREEQTEDTGEFVFGNAYRLPRRDKVDYLTDEKGVRLTGEQGDVLTTEEIPGDRARARELARLAAHLEKERSLP